MIELRIYVADPDFSRVLDQVMAIDRVVEVEADSVEEVLEVVA